jgi:hypothetical protein
LSFGRELIERNFALNVVLSLELEDIRNANPAMGADQTVRDVATVRARTRGTDRVRATSRHMAGNRGNRQGGYSTFK